MNTIEGGEILFKLGDWEIHALIEDQNRCEPCHHCNRLDKEDVRIAMSYQIPGDDHCPGCDAIQPNEIQGMVAMYNMDRPQREVWSKSFMQQIREDDARIFNEEWKKISITGNGFK